MKGMHPNSRKGLVVPPATLLHRFLVVGAVGFVGCFEEAPMTSGTGGTGSSTMGDTTESTDGATTNTTSATSSTSSSSSATDGGLPPPPPTGVSADGQPIKRIHVTWDASEGAATYQLEWRPNLASPAWTPLGPPVSQTEFDAVGAFLPAWVDAEVRVTACNANGCSAPSDPVPVTGLDTAIGFVKSDMIASDAGHGSALATSNDGHVIAMGAPFYTEGPGLADKGRVTTFHMDPATGQWMPLAVPYPGPGAKVDQDDRFGSRVALDASGERLVISSPEPTTTEPVEIFVYAWDENMGAWSSTPVLLSLQGLPPCDALGETGLAISGDGNLIAVGCKENGNYVATWRLAGNLWTGPEKYDAPANAAPRFGYAVALSEDGTWMAVSAVGGANGATGTVHVLHRVNDAWVVSGSGPLEASVANPVNPGQNGDEGVYTDGFGASVALSADGTRLVVGAPYEDGAGMGVASDAASDTGEVASGAVFVYRHAGNDTWVLEAYVKAPTPSPNDFFGASVSISADGTLLAVGAPGDDDDGTGLSTQGSNGNAPDAGAVFLYRRTDQGWQFDRILKAYSVAGPGDRFGTAVAVSGDGTCLAVGAPGEDSENLNPENDAEQGAGAVYLY
ncbi:MAG: hypothetical protein D6705_04105 [Deltaproteobacteria bacterium]|nr:MAG: hypothetical protein D6705_04105 [Deltaproteobacteria bacterium]